MRVIFLCSFLAGVLLASKSFVEQSLSSRRSLPEEEFDSSTIDGWEDLDSTDQDMIQQFFGALLELDDAFQGFDNLPQFDEPSRRLKEVTIPSTEVHHAKYQSHHSGEGYIPHHIPHLAKKTDNLFLLEGRNLQSNWTDDSDWDFLNETDYWNQTWGNTTNYPSYPQYESYPVYYPETIPAYPDIYQYDPYYQMPQAVPTGPQIITYPDVGNLEWYTQPSWDWASQPVTGY